MTNRRKFIKQVAAVGIAGSMPTILLSREKSSQQIRLLVRGDDMGNSWGRTIGFIKSYKDGILTSASIMPPSQFFHESVQFCKENPSLCVGLHITILGTRTRSVLSPELVPSILTPNGFFYENAEELMNANPRVEEFEREIRAQIGKARASGLHFVYLDWHRGIPEVVQNIILRLCHEQKLIFAQAGVESNYGYRRISGFMPGESFPRQILPDGQFAFYAAPAITKEDQEKFYDGLNNLQPGRWSGVCHPGWAEPNRRSVTELVCSPRTKEIIRRKNIHLVSYYDLWKKEFGG